MPKEYYSSKPANVAIVNFSNRWIDVEDEKLPEHEPRMQPK